MKYKVKITDESGNVQQCSIMLGCHVVDKSASLGLALSYALGDNSKLYVMDADFVKGLLKDISAAHITSSSKALPPQTIPEPKPAKSHEYPHMKYGLPKYYAVHFGDVRTHPLDIEALKRYNEIHTTSFKGHYKFYGFDGKNDCWEGVTHFEQPVTLLTVVAFLARTDKHFNPIAPESNPIDADRYPHMLLGLPKYYAVILDQVEYPQARRVFNQIHHVNYGCNVKYCGFDGANFNNGTRAVNDVAQFNVKLDVLTAAEFLTAANEYFKYNLK